jgi:hypothetical protein
VALTDRRAGALPLKKFLEIIVEYLTEIITTIPWMTVKATPLTPHPHDPGPAGAA